MQFIITAYDYTDDQAFKRRTECREEHLASMKQKKESKEILYAGALLNEGGQMIGSVVITNFSSREELEKWLADEPYVTGQVWENITIQPFAAPDIFL